MENFQVDLERVINNLLQQNAELSKKYAYVSAAFEQLAQTTAEATSAPAPD